MFVRIRKRNDKELLAFVGPFDKDGAANWLEEFDTQLRQRRETRFIADSTPSPEGRPLPSTTTPRTAIERMRTQFY